MDGRDVDASSVTVVFLNGPVLVSPPCLVKEWFFK